MAIRKVIPSVEELMSTIPVIGGEAPPDTKTPDTRVPDTRMPDTRIPDTKVPTS